MCEESALWKSGSNEKGGQQEEMAAWIGAPPYIRTPLLNQTVGYDNRTDQWSADFLVNNGAVTPRSPVGKLLCSKPDWGVRPVDHQHTTGICDDGEAGTPRSARIFEYGGAVLIFRKIWLLVNFEALNSFLALNALVCSMQKYAMRLPNASWLLAGTKMGGDLVLQNNTRARTKEMFGFSHITWEWKEVQCWYWHHCLLNVNSYEPE